MLNNSTETTTTTTAMTGGRTARVCDSCLCKRARWFCAADDAFLCQSCDVSVHSANQLARRHDRIRLETSSFNSTTDHLPPTPWLKGFTRKARTPRSNNNKISSSKASVFSIVPEIGNDNELGFSIDENDDEHHQFLGHQQEVPVFDPLFDDQKLLLTHELEDFGDGFLPSEVDLAEFVADVENLLGKEEEEEQQQQHDGNTIIVKVKDEELVQDCINKNNNHNGFWMDWDFKEEIEEEEEDEEELKIKNKKNIISLRLNYDAVITAWDAQSSPYTTGNRPQFDLDDCLEEWSGICSKGGRNVAVDDQEWRRNYNGIISNGEREARVSRYREKRRTRLFSKKIRYQVRKLNAEKRPRMKGRFVKRTTTT
ncbi:hypothetical protein IC575_004815 [Cucumis melo]|nr:zinc finger protein CONSTANS-LIKE 16 [Cucumis melo]